MVQDFSIKVFWGETLRVSVDESLSNLRNMVQDGVENASVSLRQPCCGLFACTATSRLGNGVVIREEEEKSRGNYPDRPGNWEEID